MIEINAASRLKDDGKELFGYMEYWKGKPAGPAIFTTEEAASDSRPAGAKVSTHSTIERVKFTYKNGKRTLIGKA